MRLNLGTWSMRLWLHFEKCILLCTIRFAYLPMQMILSQNYATKKQSLFIHIHSNHDSETEILKS